MSGLEVDRGVLEARAGELQGMAGRLAALVPELAVAATRSGLHELVAFGIFSGLPVAADLMAMCLPGTPSSIPDAVAELSAMAAALRAAQLAYVAVDDLRWARAELPTAEALLMLAAWNRLHLAVNLTRFSAGPLPALLLDRAGEAALDRVDRWVEGGGRLREVDAASMPALPATPAYGLASLLTVVDAVSSVRHPATAVLIKVGDEPPRYVLCLPGLQDSAGADGSAADLPGALATLTGHSSYIRGMRRLLRSLPVGSQVLLVGHSQGGMVAEALAAQHRVGRATIEGVLTAGAPLVLTPLASGIPYLALQNNEDPVPKLGRVASEQTLSTLEPTPQDRVLVRFATKGRWVSAAKHNLTSGGYIAIAGSDDRRVKAFGDQLHAFFTCHRVDVAYWQVTDADGPLPP